MALVTVAGQGVIGGTACLPRVGFWHMDAVIDSAQALSGSVQVDFGPFQLQGFILSGAPYTDTGYYRIVGGAGGLAGSKLCKPRAFGSCQMRTPLQQIMLDTGEQLDSSSDSAVLTTQLNGWTLLGVSGGRQLMALLQSAPQGTAYRFLDGGNLWVGAETWPDSDIEYEELGQLPHEQRLQITTQDVTLKPGVTLDGKRCSYVEHRITSGSLNTLALLEAA